MFNYKRIEDIFNYIRSNDYTTAAKLADLFKVSDRTIRTVKKESRLLFGNWRWRKVQFISR